LLVAELISVALKLLNICVMFDDIETLSYVHGWSLLLSVCMDNIGRHRDYYYYRYYFKPCDNDCRKTIVGKLGNCKKR